MVPCISLSAASRLASSDSRSCSIALRRFLSSAWRCWDFLKSLSIALHSALPTAIRKVSAAPPATHRLAPPVNGAAAMPTRLASSPATLMPLSILMLRLKRSLKRMLPSFA
ncbi:hypothetical protein D3C80_1690880 [compost metagenome]